MNEFYWDDLRVTAQMLTMGSMESAEIPRWAPFAFHGGRGPSLSGLYGWHFIPGDPLKGLVQSAFFQAQLPHGYKEGEGIEPHIHCSLKPYSGWREGQVLTLELEYQWYNIGEARTGDTSMAVINYPVKEGDLETENLLISFGFIEKKNAKISSLLDCRFSRVRWGVRAGEMLSDGFFDDSFDGALVLKEIDFHYPVDLPGSRTLYEK